MPCKKEAYRMTGHCVQLRVLVFAVLNLRIFYQCSFRIISATYPTLCVLGINRKNLERGTGCPGGHGLKQFLQRIPVLQSICKQNLSIPNFPLHLSVSVNPEDGGVTLFWNVGNPERLHDPIILTTAITSLLL
jgi:hypothetical protein